MSVKILYSSLPLFCAETSPIAIPATAPDIGIPPSRRARELAQTEPIEVEPFEAIASDTNLIVYGVGFSELGLISIPVCGASEISKYNIKDNYSQEIQLNTNKDNTIQNIFDNNPKQITITILEQFLERPVTQQIDNKDDSEYQKISDEFKNIQKIRLITDLNKGDVHNYCINFNLRNAELDNLVDVPKTLCCSDKI